MAMPNKVESPATIRIAVSRQNPLPARDAALFHLVPAVRVAARFAAFGFLLARRRRPRTCRRFSDAVKEGGDDGVDHLMAGGATVALPATRVIRHICTGNEFCIRRKEILVV
jgi:hypothetical protein